MSINQQPPKNTDSGRILAGVIIIAFGIILLAKQLNFNIEFPSWLTSGKMIIILIGLVIGATSNFKNPASYILIAIGAILMVKDEFNINLWKVIFPAAIIGLGVWLLSDRPSLRKRPLKFEKKPEDNFDWDPRQSSYTTQDTWDIPDESTFSDSEYVKSTAVFSEVRKIVVTKNFRGANLVNIFGGTDLNLMQTDLSQPVIIEVFQIFAGTKIIVPSNWRVVSEVISVFGEVDDRRFGLSNFKDDHKVVYLRGTSVFGGITIKSM